MQRRHWLQAAACLSASAAEAAGKPTRAGPPAGSKPLIVMVHGAFHWGGCFAKVANLLAARGYPVATPDNRSHGFDPTPYSAVTTLAQYCEPVAQLVSQSPHPVVLLGHSMGGVTLSYLAERHPEKIRSLIYLAAIMCPAGATVVGSLSKDAPANAPSIFDPNGPPDGLTLKTSDPALVRSVFYGDCSDHDVKVATANLNIINPLAPATWVSDITPARYGRVRRAYIECTEDRALPLATQRRFQADVPGATVRALPTSHSPFFSQPEALADLIEQLA